MTKYHMVVNVTELGQRVSTGRKHEIEWGKQVAEGM